ncbi:MAG TPA: succinate dehydrogenase assembly factor 2 [Acetobacteraceae bacterium]|nr:succinate dehydrogenase assembly factor 2 [Acetobacteraceae bacterium]
MPDPIDPPRDARRRRALFRATHRGTHETDLLVGGYVESRIDRFTEAEMDALEALLDLPDPDLADWLTGRVPLPDDAAPMLRAMRDAAVRR